MKEELAANEAKPPKLSVADRLTQMEGLMLRMMEYHGMIKPDPNLTQPSPAGGVENGGMDPNVMPSVPGTPAPPQAQSPGVAGIDTSPAGAMNKAAADERVTNYLFDLMLQNGFVPNGVSPQYEKRASATNELLPGMGKVSNETPATVQQPLKGAILGPALPHEKAASHQATHIHSGLRRAMQQLRPAT
jgi:hypothetical protein